MQNSIKILLVTGSLNQGGAEYQILLLSKLLLSKGYNAELIALTDYTYYLPFVKENKIPFTCIKNNGNNFQRLHRAINGIIQKEPDLVISYIKKVSQIAILAKIFSGFKFKLMISERTSAIRYWHDIYYFNLALFSNKILVNSISKYGYIIKRFPLIKKRTIFIPNLIDIKRFAEVHHVESSDDSARLTFVGRISPEKNLLNLVKAIKIVRDNGFKVCLSLFGEAHNRKYLMELNQLIKELLLLDSVKYEGPVKDVVEIYKKTDLLCLVSYYEGLSNVLSEAISCGIPVIASNIPENRYLIEDKRNGFLVEPVLPVSIADGIIKYILLDQNGVEIISNNNRKKACELFNEETTYNAYKEMFESLIA